MRTYLNATVTTLLITVVFIAGCQQPAQIEDKPVCFAQSQKQKAFEASEKVLKNMNFTIEKLDLENCYISTRPLSGGELLEFWRSDNASITDAMHSSLHSIRRSVQLQFTEKAETVCIDCTVSVERLSMPSTEIATYSEMPSMFSKGSASRQQLRLKKDMERQMTWIPLDDDDNLAALIKQKIKTQINK